MNRLEAELGIELRLFLVQQLLFFHRSQVDIVGIKVDHHIVILGLMNLGDYHLKELLLVIAIVVLFIRIVLIRQRGIFIELLRVGDQMAFIGFRSILSGFVHHKTSAAWLDLQG